jgi:hypothetical protein
MLSLLLLCWLAPQNQSPNQHVSQKQIAKQQVQPSKTAQEPPDLRPESAPIIKSYTYNARNENDTEAAKIIFDGLLVLATIGLVWVGIRQANILKKHEEWMEKHDEKLGKLAKSASDNASAANATATTADHSAVAIKNIHRAWVLFVWQQIPHGTAEEFTFSIRNWGQTPARIDCVMFDERVWVRSDLGNIPAASTFFTFPHILAPSEHWTIRRVNAKGVAGGEWSAVYNGTKVCVWHGMISYRDVLDEATIHETWFCYWYSPKEVGLHVGGPPEYNKAT